MRFRIGIDLEEAGPKQGRRKARLLAAIREHGSHSLGFQHAPWV
jgi:hypothetical protein